MANSTDLNALSTQYIKVFNDTMRMSLHNVRGGQLKQFCETMVMSTLEAGVFFRNEGMRARDVAPNVYDPNSVGFVGEQEGDAKGQRRFEVKPDYSYWVQRLKITDVNKSMLKPDSSFMRQAYLSLASKEDLKIIFALEARLADFGFKFGDNTLYISDPTNIKALRTGINMVSSFSSTAVSGVEHPQDYGAIIINHLDYVELTTTGGGTGNDDLLINQNFDRVVGRNGNLTTVLFGMPILVYRNFPNADDWQGREAVIPSGNIYIIPDKSIGFVEWEGGNAWKAEYQMENSNTMYFMAQKSGGARAIDVEFMCHIAVKPADFADIAQA